MSAGEAADLASCTSLPADVIFYILRKLPVETLLRFRCVCKDWNSIITSQSFINMHLLSQPHCLLFSHYLEQPPPFAATYDKTKVISFFPAKSFYLVPHNSGLAPCRILVGSLDGILCLTNWSTFGREIHLWNPSIRECKTLSGSCLFHGKYCQRFFHPRTKFVLGLGFRARSSDYIVIRIAFFEWRSRRLKKKPLSEAEIFSLTTNSWEKVSFSEDVLQRVRNIWSCKYAIVDGNFNWMAKFSDGEERSYFSILSFDVNKEEFREIKLPSDYINGIGMKDVKIGVFGELLAVFILGDSIPNDGNAYVWLWVMEEYGKANSWTKTRIKTRGFDMTASALDGRIVFQEGCGYDTSAWLFDMETLEEHQLSIRYFESVHTFKETLVSIQGAKVVSQ